MKKKRTLHPKAILQEWLLWHEQQTIREVPAQENVCGAIGRTPWEDKN